MRCNIGNSLYSQQGGVTSAILFTVYLDELLVRLEKTNVGCYIGHEWYGGFGY